MEGEMRTKSTVDQSTVDSQQLTVKPDLGLPAVNCRLSTVD